MTKRHYSMEQLNKKYAREIQEKGCIDYSQFIYDCVGMSSDPEGTFKDWYLELNREGRKDFCKNMLMNIEDYGQRILRWAIELL